VAVHGHFARETPEGSPKIYGKGVGAITGKLGVHIHLISKKAIAAEASGGTGIELTAAPTYSKGDEPAFQLDLKWTGVKGTITVKFFDRWETTYETQLVDKKTIWSKSSWSLIQETP
jgi:hypothetical protein